MAKRQSGKRAKKETNSIEYAPFVAATLGPSDFVARYRGHPAVRDLVDSCKSWAAICCGMKAETAASYPIRMYARSEKRKGQKVQGKRLADLRKADVSGTKSAQYAESAGSNVVEVLSDPALNILHKPNPFAPTGHELFYSLFAFQEACGNAFVEVKETGDPSKPYELLPLFPQDVAIEPNYRLEEIPSLVSKYFYGRGSTRIELEYNEVIHFKRAPSMFSPLWGSSPLQGVRAEADLLEMATLNELANWQNGCSVNLAYEVPTDTTDVQIKQIRSQFEARHQGPEKAGKVFIGAGKLSALDLKAKEMEYREGQRYYSQMILSAYRVPESKVRLNDANLGSARTADVEYLGEGIRPMLVRMAETLTEEILYKRLGYERGSVWFAYDDIVPRDIATVNAAAVGLVQNRIWTPDEARAELGYGPLPNGEGAKLVTPIGGMGTPAAPVIDGEKVPQAPQGPALAAETAEAVAAPPADLALNGAQIDSLLSIAQLVATGQLPSAAAREILFASFPTVAKERIEAIIGGLEGFKPQAPEAPAKAPPVAEAPPETKSVDCCSGLDCSAWNSYPSANSCCGSFELSCPPCSKSISWETVKDCQGKTLKGKRAQEGGIHVLGGRTLRALDASGKSVTDDAINALIKRISDWYASAPLEGGDVDSRAKELAGILKPELEAIFKAGGVEGLSTLAGIEGGAARIAETGVSFDVLPEKAVEFLNGYTIRLARSITETQHEDLKGAISAAIDAGMNPNEAKAAVQAELPEVAGWKADQIARTETTRAYTAGNLAAWTEAGVARKQWLLAPDACPQCEGIAQQFNEPIALGDSFLKVGDSFSDSSGAQYSISYADIDAPPLHPGDRCDIAPVL